MFMSYLQVGSYSIAVAKILGVSESIFLTCIENEFNYQKRLKALNANDTVSITRAEIYERTGLDDNAQISAEIALVKCGIISVKPLQNVPNKNYYILYIEQLENIITAPDPFSVISSADVKQFIKSPRVEPMSKRQTKIAELKRCIRTNDPVLQDYLCKWIDSVYANPKGFLSPKGLDIVQNELLTYSKGNQEVQIDVLKIAIKNGLRDLTWAIERYEKQNNIVKGSMNFAVYNDVKVEKPVEDVEVF